MSEEFFDQVLLGRTLGRVLLDYRLEKRLVLDLALPRQNGVAREHPMTDCIEAARLVAAGRSTR